MSRPATILTWLGLVATVPTLVSQAQTSSGDAARGATITRSGSQPSAPRARPSISLDLCGSIPCSRRSSRHASRAGTSPLSPARSAWHTHPAGQILIVTSGLGWVQEWGGPKQEIRPGDVVRIAPGVKHWHGASATTGMTHIAIQEAVDGRNVDWMEQVSNEQYQAR